MIQKVFKNLHNFIIFLKQNVKIRRLDNELVELRTILRHHLEVTQTGVSEIRTAINDTEKKLQNMKDFAMKAQLEDLLKKLRIVHQHLTQTVTELENKNGSHDYKTQ